MVADKYSYAFYASHLCELPDQLKKAILSTQPICSPQHLTCQKLCNIQRGFTQANQRLSGSTCGENRAYNFEGEPRIKSVAYTINIMCIKTTIITHSSLSRGNKKKIHHTQTPQTQVLQCPTGFIRKPKQQGAQEGSTHYRHKMRYLRGVPGNQINKTQKYTIPKHSRLSWQLYRK